MATTKPVLESVWAKDAAPADLEDPGLAKYNEGWLYGEKPPHKFMNWIQNVFSKAFAHLNERGVLEHDLTTPYLNGAMVWKGNKVFKARQANTGQDTALTTYWQEQSLPDMPASGDGFILYYTGAKLYWKDQKDLNYGTYEGRVAADKKSYTVVNDNTLSNPPLASEINVGELALNFKEKALYTKTPEGAIIVLSGAASIKDFEFTAAAGQTTFTPPGGYVVGQIEVFINGRKQSATDYVANNSTTVVFTTGLIVGDLVVISVWGSFSVADAYTQAQVDALLAAAIPGSVIQVANFTTGAVATGTATIPYDNTIPQITEGTQFMSLNFTPKRANSRLLIQFVWNGSHSLVDSTLITALFDGSANAVCVEYQAIEGAYYTKQIVGNAFYQVASVAPITFSVRAGSNTASTVTFNGPAGVAYFGGKIASSITITEIAQ